MYTKPIRNIHNNRPSKPLAVLLAAAGLATLGLSLNVQAQGTAPAQIAPPATFAAHDGNGDGFISKAEFDTFRQSSQNAGRPMFRAVTFEALDSNRDGKISQKNLQPTLAPVALATAATLVKKAQAVVGVVLVAGDRLQCAKCPHSLIST